jgi:peroxiredoxin
MLLQWVRAVSKFVLNQPRFRRLRASRSYNAPAMFKITAAIVAFMLAISPLAVPSGPVPRKAPELSFSDPSGKAISLSNFKGKVVAIEFFFVRSMHCVRVAQTLNKLNDELSSRGFQALAVAFSAPQAEADAATVDNFVQSYRLTFPVGYTGKGDVDGFLSRSKDDVLNIPQVVIIDRAGMIRAQSGNRPGDPKLEDGDSLRALLDGLLKESAPAKPASPSKSGKASSTR